MRKIFTLILVAMLFSTLAYAQSGSNPERGRSGEAPGHQEDRERDDHDDNGPVQVGWAVVTPAPVTTSAGSGTMTVAAGSSGIVVFETFGLKEGEGTMQAGLLPGDLTTSSVMFVSANGRLSRNIGIGIVNPNSAPANVTMTLRNETGGAIGAPKTILVAAGHQTAQFITSLFGDRPDVPRDLTGTLSVTSTLPVAIAGLRFRGSNFSTLPITNLSPAAAAGVVLPHFAAGGGWATELVIVNTSTQQVNARVDFFKQDGTAMTVRLNGESKTSFTDLTIPAGGVLELAPKDREGHSRF